MSQQSSTPPILEFFGEYRFLSNFWPVSFVWDTELWRTAEHAYQAAKCVDPIDRVRIRDLASAGYAKRAGRIVTMRPDWNVVRFDIMLQIVHAKFSQNPDLMEKLLATGDAVLEEGNNWKDRVWGICPPGSSNGRNELGKILMQIRQQWSDPSA